MSHQDLSSENTPYCFGVQLREAIKWLVLPKAFADVQFRKDCTWTAWTLTAAAMLWAWTDEPTLTGRFASIRQIIQNAFGVQQELAGSYQAGCISHFAFGTGLCRKGTRILVGWGVDL